MDAARAPEWSLTIVRPGEIMATRDSGQIGQPWVVLAARGGRGLRVSKYQPGDDLDIEGEHVAELKGNPREVGRQLRDLLCDLDISH